MGQYHLLSVTLPVILLPLCSKRREESHKHFLLDGSPSIVLLNVAVQVAMGFHLGIMLCHTCVPELLSIGGPLGPPWVELLQEPG